MNIRNYFRSVLNLFFPTPCFICGKYLSQTELFDVCSSCIAETVNEDKRIKRCPECENSMIEEHCESCDRGLKLSLPIHSSFYNDGLFQKILYATKFDNREDFLQVIKKLIWGKDEKLFTWADAIIPIENSKTSIENRGYCVVSNVMDLIAQKTEAYLYFPLIINEKKTHKIQHFLTAKERVENVKDYFEVFDVDALKGLKRLLIVDDIYTTGATMSSFVETLSKYLDSDVEIRLYSFSRTPLIPQQPHE